MKKELVCKKKDGFWFYSIFDYKGAALSKDAIIIDEKDTDKFVSYINKEKIDKVIIDLWNSDIDSLSFLKDINHIKYLVIWGNGDIDYSPIYNLKHLKLLGVSGSNEIYVNKIEGLESFSTAYPNNAKGIDEVKSLKSLELVGFYAPGNFKNLNFLTNLNNLDTLLLDNINITTLEGVENLKNLKVLILQNMKKLETIEHLSTLTSNLKNLRIESCNKIRDFDSIKDLSELVFLSIDRVKLVPSLEFIYNLKKLNSFVSVSSNFIDGNMKPLININHVVVDPLRKHYYITKLGENKKLRESDFQYGEREMGDEDIELWRRIAY